MLTSRVLITAAALGLFAGCGSDTVSTVTPDTAVVVQPPAAAREFGTGFEQPPQEVLDNHPRALPPEAERPGGFQAKGEASALTSPPAVVTLSPVPPVQNQSHTGGCVSFGVGYELISTVTGQGQRNLQDMSQCSSSAWGYLNALNLEGKACAVDSKNSTPGTFAGAYLNTAVNVGAVSYATLPFPSPSPVQVLVQELNAINATIGQHPPSSQFQLGSWATVENTVESLKAQLAAGRPMSIGINEPAGLSAYRGGLYSPSPQPSPGGGHCMFLMGYDDTQGAFLIQNSWGTKWGEQGRIYWAYDSLVKFLQKDAVHTAMPVSTAPVDPASGSNGTVIAAKGEAHSLEVLRAHQAQARDGRVYLVAEVRFQPAVQLTDYTLVSPSGRRAQVPFHNLMRSGYLYLSRQDGQQWTPGVYRLEVNGHGFSASASLTVRAVGDLPAGDTPLAGVTGGNRRPVAVR